MSLDYNFNFSSHTALSTGVYISNLTAKQHCFSYKGGSDLNQRPGRVKVRARGKLGARHLLLPTLGQLSKRLFEV